MPNNYINNKIFEKTIAEFQQAKEDDNKERLEEIKIELASLFYLLADNIFRAFKFQLIDTDDSIQEGVSICFEKLDKFKPERGRAFNYYTTCILNHYRQLYRSAKNYNELKKRFHEYTINKLDEVFLNVRNNQTKAVFRRKISDDPC